MTVIKTIELIEKESLKAGGWTLTFDMHNGHIENAVLSWVRGTGPWEHELSGAAVAELSVIGERAATVHKKHNGRWDAVNASIAIEGED